LLVSIREGAKNEDSRTNDQLLEVAERRRERGVQACGESANQLHVVPPALPVLERFGDVVPTHPPVELRDLNPRRAVGVAPEPNLADLLVESAIQRGGLAIRVAKSMS
jgi:hypothetical protein